MAHPRREELPMIVGYNKRIGSLRTFMEYIEQQLLLFTRELTFILVVQVT